jgi:uncharacterized protein YsxB (DUF464 family)
VVTVTFRRDSHNRLSSVFAEGHAGWADPGEDVVCAAASAILQAAWLGLAMHAHVDVDGERTGGRLAIRWPESERDREDVQAIVATAELSIVQIARQYPKNINARRAKEA